MIAIYNHLQDKYNDNIFEFLKEIQIEEINIRIGNDSLDHIFDLALEEIQNINFLNLKQKDIIVYKPNTKHHSRVMPFSNDKVVTIFCFKSQELRAFARHHGSMYFVGVSTRLIQTIYNLSKLLPRLDDESIPPGFEDLAFQKALVDQNNNTYYLLINSSIYLQFRQSVKFIFLHELGHLIGGHIDLLKNLSIENNLSYIEESINLASRKQDYNLYDVNIPYKSFEIEADRYALKSIFSDLYQSLYTNHISHQSVVTKRIYTIFSCLAFPLAFQGDYYLDTFLVSDPDISVLDNRHPRLDFRAYDILCTDSEIFKKIFSHLPQPIYQQLLFRRNQELAYILETLKTTHASTLDFLSVINTPEFENMAQTLIEEVIQRMQPFSAKLSELRWH